MSNYLGNKNVQISGEKSISNFGKTLQIDKKEGIIKYITKVNRNNQMWCEMIGPLERYDKI